jgi:predicted SAM-dependent methyltransferase
MEHIEYSKLKDVINEIYRVLKPNGLFRLSLPNYDSKILFDRSIKDKNKNIIFDEGGGGYYDNKTKTVMGVPTYESVKKLLDSTNFKENKILFLHYTKNGNHVLNEIDYSKGYIKRTPDHDDRVKISREALSIVVDCHK